MLDINKTLKLLENVYKKTNLPVKPKYLLLNKKSKDSVIGLLLETNRILPVKPISLKKVSSKLKVSNKFYYENVNANNYSENEKIKRINEIKKYKYNLEGFERFKYEFSSYLQDNEKIKNKIIEYLDENKNNLLKKEIDNILKKIIASKEKSIKKLNNILKLSYKEKMLRVSCHRTNPKSGKIDKFCVCDNNKCKFIDYNIKIYKNKLLELLLRYPLDRIEIIDGTLPLINESSSSKYQVGEILLTGNKIDDNFNKIIYNNKNNIELKLIKDIDLIQPEFEGIDTKYLKDKDVSKEAETFSVRELARIGYQLLILYID